MLIPGARAPKLISREMLSEMQPGAVIVDVAIDQGGCIETAHPTTHSDPVYEVDGIIHYCVANMPGGVPVTSTKSAHERDAAVRRGDRRARARRSRRARRGTRRAASTSSTGKVTYEAVAEAHGLDYTPLADVPAARAGLARRWSPLGFFCGGVSRTTTHVIAGGDADDRDAVDAKRSSPRTSDTAYLE